jgi:hypothetical protein
MDAKTIMKIKPALNRFLKQFDDCFGRSSTRQYLPVYICGQLSDLPRKSIEPMADAAGVPSRNLQEFLSLYRWDAYRLRDRRIFAPGLTKSRPSPPARAWFWSRFKIGSTFSKFDCRSSAIWDNHTLVSHPDQKERQCSNGEKRKYPF